jgi:hypothetical protein
MAACKAERSACYVFCDLGTSVIVVRAYFKFKLGICICMLDQPRRKFRLEVKLKQTMQANLKNILFLLKGLSRDK